jgi:catechol 2,3-dioxygenase-like lactoylglutathione lyase family enzyme
MSDLTFDHVALPMFDPAATRAFYEDVLGLPLIDALEGDDWGGCAWLMMIFAAGHGRHLALCAFRGLHGPLDGPWPREGRHYAFAAPDDAALLGWRTKLGGFGLALREEEHDGRCSIYFEDPNGTTIEIAAPPTLRAGRNVEAADIVARWIEAAL